LLFTQASSLPDAQVRAMCALLFGWTAPEDEEEASGTTGC